MSVATGRFDIVFTEMERAINVSSLVEGGIVQSVDYCDEIQEISALCQQVAETSEPVIQTFICS